MRLLTNATYVPTWGDTMAKRFFATVAAFVLVLTLGPVAPPASAANAVVEVPGHAGLAGAGLWYIAQRCDNPAANPDSQYIETPAKDGGVRGTHALGWKFPTMGNEIGALGYTPSPSTLTLLESYIKGVNSPGLEGHAVAIFDDTAGNFTGGRWVGRSSQFALNSAGWVRVNAGTTTMEWRHYTGGIQDGGPLTGTVAQFATARGNGSGAYVGFAMGCNAEQFFMDALTVGNAGNSVTYDYEGLPTGSRLLWWAGRKVHNDDVEVGYGSRFFMLGDSYDANGFIVGQGTFFEKRYGRGSFVPVKTARFDLDSYAAYLVSPKRQTTYWFANDGSDAHEGSAADTITVKVFAGVSGRLLDDTLRPGQRAVVTGRLKPGNRGVKVSLQRKLGGWKTVATTRSRGGGAFDVGVKARAPGKMVLRLSIAKGKGNLGTKTNSVTVTVKPRPRPDPPDPGGGGDDSTHSQDTATESSGNVPPPDYRSLLLLAKMAVDPPFSVETPSALSASCAMPSVFAMGSCATVD
jgi:hypothetical protein